jgi:2-polyprenyl-6-hydroxyphenyl methylase/3-demethylubiquinone-9 3-methyltransferase
MLVRYEYDDVEPAHTHAYLWPVIRRIVDAHDWRSRRAFDLGCGNGATCRALMAVGFDAVGVDPSETGVSIAQKNGVRADVASAYDDLSAYGRFPLVTSLEVIAHCHDPRAFIRTFLSLIEPGGVGILSTPYHGYLKNLALALTGRLDEHFNALWPGGPLKFFSVRTLRQLLNEHGAHDVRFIRLGRVPPLAKSVVALVKAG